MKQGEKKTLTYEKDQFGRRRTGFSTFGTGPEGGEKNIAGWGRGVPR